MNYCLNRCKVGTHGHNYIFYRCGLGKLSICKCIVILLNRAGRTILKVPSRTSASAVRCELGRKTLQERRDIHINTMVFKCLTGNVPSYLGDVFVLVSELHCHRIRNSTVGNVVLPHLRTGSGRRTFNFRGAQAWNNLPQHLKSLHPTSFNYFVKQLKQLS